ncbi:organic cation transporter protein-like isoform X2 [Argopecten irradians]|uniref:organic cation transporter protein-like isoform X2 n=1 Tax=Argopecten irradians TaxID=31199 RepID=UPI0037144338
MTINAAYIKGPKQTVKTSHFKLRCSWSPLGPNNEHVNLDDVWRALGVRGKYQMTQAALLILTLLPEAIQLVVVVFIGYRPPHQCANLTSEDISLYTGRYINSSVDITYHDCSVDLAFNGTNTTHLSLSPCPAGFTYDLEKDRTFVTEYDLVCDGAERAELSQTLLIVGQMLGAAILPQCADRFGRKPVFVLSNIGILVAGIGGCFLPTITGFAIMRFLVGIGQQGMAMVMPAMILEMIPVEFRFMVEVSSLTVWTTSMIVVTPVAYFLRDISWRYLYFVLTLTSSFTLFGYWIYNESVRWLLANGKFDEAKRILRKAAKMNKVDESHIMNMVDKVIAVEFNVEEEVVVDEDTSMMAEEPINNTEQITKLNKLPKYTIFTLFKRRRIAMITSIMIFVWTVDSLVYYGLILSSASLPVDRYLSFFLLTVAEYPVVLFEYTLFNRIGRKWFCIIFHAVAAVSLIAGTVANYFSDLPGSNIAVMIFFFLGKLGITGSFSCLFLFTPEIFPTNLRTVGMGLPSAAGRIGGMLAPFAGPLAERVKWAPGAIFGCLCLLVTIVTPFLPEPMGHELPTLVEDLEEWYKANSGTKFRKSKR